MNKIKTLLGREYMLGRKKTLFGLIALAMITVLCWLALISVKHGNLADAFANLDKDMPGMSKRLSDLVYYAAMYAPAFVSISLMNENGAVSADLKSGWKLFSRTLPITPAEKIGAKYILKAIILVAVFLIDLGNFAVVSALADREMSGVNVKALLFLINIDLLSELIKCAVLYNAKTEKGTMPAEFASFSVLIILCIPYFFRLRKSLSGITADNEFLGTLKIMGVMAGDIKRIFPLMLPVMIILLAGGYFLHLAILRRSEI